MLVKFQFDVMLSLDLKFKIMILNAILIELHYFEGEKKH